MDRGTWRAPVHGVTKSQTTTEHTYTHYFTTLNSVRNSKKERKKIPKYLENKLLSSIGQRRKHTKIQNCFKTHENPLYWILWRIAKTELLEEFTALIGCISKDLKTMA